MMNEKTQRKISRSYPHVCPVCKGRGEIGEDLAQHGAPVKYLVGPGPHVYACHVCCGSCMVWEYVQEDAKEEQVIPNLPYIGISPVINVPPVSTEEIFVPPVYEPVGTTYHPIWVVDPAKMPKHTINNQEFSYDAGQASC